MTADREADGNNEEPTVDESVAAEPPADDLQAVYDRIADHFAKTREYAWPEVESFISDEVDRRGSLDCALDLGCGNGRHAQGLAEADAEVVGLDVSGGLLAEARQRAAERGFDVDLVHGDASRLPFADDRFSQVVYVATLHHLPTRAARQRSLSAVGRVLAPDGRGLVSAWSTAHDRFDADEGFDTTVDWTLPGGETVGRYYHIYDPDEFRADLAAASVEVVDCRLSSGNCYAVVAPPEGVL
ncbi:MAG: methyltransferase domain-containing protein [Halohasta sp.]